MAIIVLSYIQENELIKYYISDEILTIEITKKQSVNDKDSRLGQSFGEDQSMRMKQNIIKFPFRCSSGHRSWREKWNRIPGLQTTTWSLQDRNQWKFYNFCWWEKHKHKNWTIRHQSKSYLLTDHGLGGPRVAFATRKRFLLSGPDTKQVSARRGERRELGWCSQYLIWRVICLFLLVLGETRLYLVSWNNSTILQDSQLSSVFPSWTNLGHGMSFLKT